jgi:biotin transporter BioY
MLAGLLIVYGFGALWLAFFAQNLVQTPPLGLHAALIAGVYPFVVADLLKIAAAAGISPILWRLVGSDTR